MRDLDQTPARGGDAGGGGVTRGDAELIAAFVDKRLSSQERSAFLDRLDGDEALYEVFIETVRYREQTGAAPGELVAHPSGRPRWGRLGAIAALIAAAIATPLVLRNLSPPSYVRSLTAGGGLEAALGPGWYDQQWSVTRGIGADTDEADAAFRLGVRVVDLEVALRAGWTDDAVVLTHRIEVLLDAVELADPLQLSYSRVRARLEEGAPAEALALAESTRPLVGELFGELEHAYELGRWAEAGKLAARSGNRKLLRAQVYRRSLRRLRGESWAAEVERDLAALGELLEVRAARLDLPRLEEAFTALIARS